MATASGHITIAAGSPPGPVAETGLGFQPKTVIYRIADIQNLQVCVAQSDRDNLVNQGYSAESVIGGNSFITAVKGAILSTGAWALSVLSHDADGFTLNVVSSGLNNMEIDFMASST